MSNFITFYMGFQWKVTQRCWSTKKNSHHPRLDDLVKYTNFGDELDDENTQNDLMICFRNGKFLGT